MNCIPDHYIIHSMEDFDKIPEGYSFYLFSEPLMLWGIYGITQDRRRRFCEYLFKEPEAILWKEGVHLYIWRGNRRAIRQAETKLKQLLRETVAYDDINTINKRGNQVEFFPNEYINFMVSLVTNTIKKIKNKTSLHK